MQPYLCKIVVVYLDDILIFSNSFQEHINHLKVVLQALDKAGLKLNIKKCVIATRQVEFLGYLFTNQTITIPIKQRMKAINYQTPETQKELRAFLGFTGYFRRFVPNYTQKVFPLYDFLKKEKKGKIEWTNNKLDTFIKIKTAINQAIPLMMPDLKKNFILETDASIDTIAGALLQTDDNGTEQVVYYISRKLNEHERNYTITEKELLSIIWSVKKLKTYLSNPFVIRNDHKPLSHFINLEHHNARVIRWVLYLSQFTYNITHIAGKENYLSDALTRYTVNTTDICSISESEITEQTKLDKIKQIHERLGHAGRTVTLLAARDQLSSKNISKLVEMIVRSCKTCQYNSNKGCKRNQQRIPLIKPFEMMAIDTIGPLPKSQNKKTFILVAIDTFTRFCITKAVTNKNAKTVAKFINDDVFLKHGVPLQLLSDQGREYDNKLVRQLCDTYNCTKIFTTPYNPQCNGAVERVNGTLISKLSRISENDESKWDEYLQYATLAVNVSPNTRTKYSPYELIYGFKDNIIYKNSEEHELGTYDDFIEKINEKRLRMWDVVKQERQRIIELAEQNHKSERKLQVHQVVLKRILGDTNRSKLAKKWEGPYVVVKVGDKGNTLIKDMKGNLLHINDKHLKPYYREMKETISKGLKEGDVWYETTDKKVHVNEVIKETQDKDVLSGYDKKVEFNYINDDNK